MHSEHKQANTEDQYLTCEDSMQQAAGSFNMKQWRLIRDGSNDGYWNMAVDEAIVIACREGQAPPTIRFYMWSSPFISIGYFQKTGWIFNDNIDKRFSLVRRITGGMGVFHERDLCYSIIAPRKENPFSGHLLNACNIISRALIDGLRRLGIYADNISMKKSRYPNRSYYQNNNCFSSLLGDEISVKGKKLIGNARKRWRDIFLQQGSILIESSSYIDTSLSTTMEEIIGRKVKITEVVEALTRGFSTILNIDLIDGELSDHEKILSKRLVEKRYSQESWNRRDI